jgi:hypothetical protein
MSDSEIIARRRAEFAAAFSRADIPALSRLCRKGSLLIAEGAFGQLAREARLLELGWGHAVYRLIAQRRLHS